MATAPPVPMPPPPAPPQAPYQSNERTPSDPQTGLPDDPQNSHGLTPDLQKELQQIARHYSDKYQNRYRMILQRCLKAYEYFKGNQFVSFDPENFNYFSADAGGLGNILNNYDDADEDDTRLYEYCTNEFQKEAVTFVASLSPQVPKCRFFPVNAERPKDVATAKVASTLQEMIERKNKVKSRQKQALLTIFCSGCYFRWTRYVVDARRFGTHPEQTYSQPQSVVLAPERFSCPGCGISHNASKFPPTQMPSCPQCNTAMGLNDYHPSITAQMPVPAGEQDVANGQVYYTFYSPLNVMADPEAKTLSDSAMLKLGREVDIAALRDNYPVVWDQPDGQETGAEGNAEQLARMARRTVMNGTNGTATDQNDGDTPTLEDIWLQPFAFNMASTKEIAMQLKKLFPAGVRFTQNGQRFLDAVPEAQTECWTHCGSIDETFGLYPPAPADLITGIQDKINDAEDMITEFNDRLSSGLVFVNSDIIDARQFKGKPPLAGVLNPVKLKRMMPGTGLEQAFFQMKFELNAQLYAEPMRLTRVAQSLTGVLTQVWGGPGDPNVQTKGGQEQQLGQAMQQLNPYWEATREEWAEAAVLSVMCAAKNYTDDVFDVVTDDSLGFRNQYVRLADLQGSVNAYPEADQGYPMTYAEIQAKWQQLIEMAGENELVKAMFLSPINQKQALQYLGTPGMKLPMADLEDRVMQCIAGLLQTKRVTPDLMPSPVFDNKPERLEVWLETITQFVDDHPDLGISNPGGFQALSQCFSACDAMNEKLQQANAPQPPGPKTAFSATVNYKDLDPAARVQLLGREGIITSGQLPPAPPQPQLSAPAQGAQQ